MKIYTRTGDDGETSLFAGGRISKGEVRLHAYGTVDELNTAIGIVLAVEVPADLGDALRRVQSDLFVVGADLATPLEAKTATVLRVDPAQIVRLETEIDGWEQELPPLRNFILPGGGMAGAFLHQARTVCRRAERWSVLLSGREAMNKEVLRYLNRLSDWLFVAARVANHRAGVPEQIWGRETG